MQRERTNLTKATLSKMLKHGSSMVVSAIALLVFLIIVNYIFAAKTHYVDVTTRGIHTLSEGTQLLLEDITFPINIKVFYLSRNQTRITLMLRGYQQLNENITIEPIDPLKSPIIAQEYGVTEPGTIIFEASGSLHELKPPPPGRYHTEREVTLMLYRILNDVSMTVYFTEGHGELSVNNPNFDGLSTVRDRLLEQGYMVESLNLQTVDTINPDESIIVITEPKTAISDKELATLTEYMYNGGNLILMGAPNIGEDLSPLAAWHGIAFGNNFIYETSSSKTTELGPTAPLCMPYEMSEITNGLANQNIIFPLVRSVEIFQEKENITYFRLMASSEDSWAETDIESAREIRSGVRPSRDETEQRGPIIVAVATEMELGRPVEDRIDAPIEKLMPRSAFFGNTRFISNTMIAQFPSNLNLFLNTMNWISGNEDIIEITPNAAMFTPVELRQSQRRLISWLTLFIYPAIIVAAGVSVWLRKR